MIGDLRPMINSGFIKDNNENWVTDFMSNLGIAKALYVEVYGVLDGLKFACDRSIKKLMININSMYIKIPLLQQNPQDSAHNSVAR